MTKEELQNIIEENRFSSLTCRTGDEIGDLVQEIYHDGMMAGYELAISRLQMLNRMPFKIKAARTTWKLRAAESSGSWMRFTSRGRTIRGPAPSGEGYGKTREDDNNV